MIRLFKVQGLLWFSLLGSFVGKGQVDTSLLETYQPHTEHQYYIKAQNDSLIVKFFLDNMSDKDIEKSKKGFAMLEIEIDTTGIVVDTRFKKLNQFVLSEVSKETIIHRINNQIKYSVQDEAKKYYSVIKKSPKLMFIVKGEQLVSLDSSKN